ncbi:hypothetical protein BpHYR1_047352 [Brachionus plicatilis]|uniref:Uncharacterized protein n=1 Tax=Brachionus plicatilis TaxID=10195 RepID=A0A3M7Q892_BRAPC|nr:hypothetical protein BpHYR1_047352 [Brachionus plicatilis]
MTARHKVDRIFDRPLIFDRCKFKLVDWQIEVHDQIKLYELLSEMEIFYFREVRKEFMRLISNLPMDQFILIFTFYQNLLLQINLRGLVDYFTTNGTGSSNLLSAFHTIISVSYKTLIFLFCPSCTLKK